MEKIFSICHLLTPSESDARKSLPLTLLVSQMIELATQHANHLGIGFLHLDPMGLGWVLSRLTVEMKKWPTVGQSYVLSTWVETLNRHFSERCFSIETEEGEILGFGRSVWMIIDLKTHQSVSTACIDFSQDLIPGKECPIPRQMRHKPFKADKESEYVFQYSDLDFYRHVNTVKYVALLLNQFPLACYDQNLLSRFEVAFMHEARYGERAVIKSIREKTDNPCLTESVQSDETFTTTFDVTVDERQILRSRISFTSLKSD